MQVALGPLINDRHLANVERIVTATVAAGADLRAGSTHDRLFYAPTVLGGVTQAMPACQEEIFGPAAPVIVVKDDSEAVALANDTEYGLVAAIQTGSRAPSKNQAHRVTQRGHLLPVNLLLGPRHEHGADSRALRPEGIGPQAVTDEHGILCPEPRQFERRLVNARMRFAVTNLGRCHENVDVTRQSCAGEISGQVPAPVGAQSSSESRALQPGQTIRPTRQRHHGSLMPLLQCRYDPRGQVTAQTSARSTRQIIASPGTDMRERGQGLGGPRAVRLAGTGPT